MKNNHTFRFERLTEMNFDKFEKLLFDSNEAGCYCSFWHGKWASVDAWKALEKNEPAKNRQTTLEKVRTGFHVGVLAYEGEACIAWISVGPITDFYWTWRRLAQLGEDKAKTTAAILCINIVPSYRGKGYQTKLLKELLLYAAQQGWKVV